VRVVSLFAGIGGFDLGFNRAGFEIVAHVEKDANCRKLLAARWPDAVALDDVCTAGAHNLPACDVVTYGFPCQDLSVAGKRAGLAGGRSGLYYEATRIINELKPAFALFENVPGLLSSDGGRDFARVLMEMDRIGYHGAWRLLDAQWFGVAQRRRRVFGLFSRLDSGAERCAEILSIPESLRGHPAPSRKAGEGFACGITERTRSGGRNLESIDDVAYALTNPGAGGRAQSRMVGVADVAKAVRTPTGGIDREDMHTLVTCPLTGNPYGDHESRESLLVPAVANCLQERDAKGADSDTKPGHSIPVMSVRRLTPTECERLQGFPDGWTAGFSDSTRYRMLGNAVAVPCAEWIARRLAKEFA
jgi:DNA (cytosine-5)-methyltransferase 1